MAESKKASVEIGQDSSDEEMSFEKENTNVSELLEKQKTHKQTLEEVKRKGREERARQREERKEESRKEDDEEQYFIEQLSALSISVQQPEAYKGTGLVYDELMLKHRNEWDPNFPEKPERISESFRRCQDLRLVERCVRIEKQYGTEDLVLLQHTRELLEKVKSTTEMSMEELKSFSQHYDSVYCNKDTYESALIALGSTVELMIQVLQKKITNGLAITRPPGHHAMNDELCGFCIFNNVAIAAKHAVDTLGVKKILIVDWDVHHGQATQQMFYDDPRVLYFSIHRFENGNYWPNLRESDYDFIGENKGTGFNINVPLNKTGMTDRDYLAIFYQILLPVAHEFCPDIVLVSAGYDCAIGCPEGEMMVSPAAFGHMTHHLMSLADGRLCVCLEGGYCIKSLSESIALTLKALLRDPCQELLPQQEPSDSVTESILNVIKVLRPHWECFKYQDSLEEDELCIFENVNEMPPKPGIKFNTKETNPEKFPLSYTYPAEVEEVYLKQKQFDPIIDKLIAETQLMRPPYRTCIVYDDDMRAHRSGSSWRHPEDPDRITRIFDKHVEWGLAERCLRIQSRHASEAELQLIHSSKYIENMKSMCDLEAQQLKQMAHMFNSVYLCKESYSCATLATGCLLNVVHTVLTGQSSSGVAVVRPPGHHAECTTCMGFCFFNSVAIAAKYAQQTFGLKRILILDWDVHHGNGTQHQFFEDDSVLVINLHRYDDGGFYPSSSDASETEVGRGNGEGYNVNIAWNYGRMGDAEYIAAFQQIVMPIAYQFAPELVLVSAGFDSAMGDPLGNYMISPTGYAQMTHMLSSLANGRVILTLEGGYNLTSISHSMCMCTSVLLGDPCPTRAMVTPMKIAIKTIKDVVDIHKKYWKCLKFGVKIPDITRRPCSGKVLDGASKSKSVKVPSSENVLEEASKGVTLSDPGNGLDGAPRPIELTITEKVLEESATDKVSSSAEDIKLEPGFKVNKEEVAIYIDEYPGINFPWVFRHQQKMLETETGTNLILKIQGLESKRVKHAGHVSAIHGEKVLNIQVYSDSKENVQHAVNKINEIKNKEIEAFNKIHNPDVTQEETDISSIKTAHIPEHTTNVSIEGAGVPGEERLEVISDKVAIYIDEYPGINFLRIFRSKQKMLETETGTKLFLRGQALETRGVEPGEKILFIHVYSDNREKVLLAVHKINEIKHKEIESYNSRVSSEVPKMGTDNSVDSTSCVPNQTSGILEHTTNVPVVGTGVPGEITGVQTSRDEKNSIDSLSSQLQNITVGDTSESVDMADSGNSGDSQGASGSGAPHGQEGRPNTYMDLLAQMEGKGVQQMYAVDPLKWCPHLETISPLPEGTTFLDTNAPCENCGNTSENWICLVCYRVFCSRFVNEHMLMHGIEAGHLMCLSYSDLSVWCYGCDQYVDNQVLKPAKNAAHIHKFGEALPGS